MSAEERKALSFVAILLGLSVLARAMNRPQPIEVAGASSIDIQARLEQNQQVREQVSGPPRKTAGGRPRRVTPAPRRLAPPVVIDNRQPAPRVPDILDLNRATASELDGLPGISPTVAERIVQYRTERGYFASVEQLDSVKGIGPALLAKVRPRVKVR